MNEQNIIILSSQCGWYGQKQRNLFTVLNWLVNAVQLHSPHTNTHWFHIKRLVVKWPQRTASYKHKLQQRQRFCHLGLKYVIKNLSFCNKVDLLASFLYSSTAVSLFSRQKKRDTNQYKTIDRLFFTITKWKLYDRWFKYKR